MIGLWRRRSTLVGIGVGDEIVVAYCCWLGLGSCSVAGLTSSSLSLSAKVAQLSSLNLLSSLIHLILILILIPIPILIPITILILILFVIIPT